MRYLTVIFCIPLTLAAPLAAPTCNVNFPCLSEPTITATSPFQLAWSAAYFRNTPLAVRLFQGDLTTEPQSDPCNAWNSRSKSTTPLYEWTIFNSSTTGEFASFTSLSINYEKLVKNDVGMNDTVFFQVRAADGNNCQLSSSSRVVLDLSSAEAERIRKARETERPFAPSTNAAKEPIHYSIPVFTVVISILALVIVGVTIFLVMRWRRMTEKKKHLFRQSLEPFEINGKGKEASIVSTLHKTPISLSDDSVTSFPPPSAVSSVIEDPFKDPKNPFEDSAAETKSTKTFNKKISLMDAKLIADTFRRELNSTDCTDSTSMDESDTTEEDLNW